MGARNPKGVDHARRHLLKTGAVGVAVLATAGLTASLVHHSGRGQATGMSVLRSTDLPFLSAIIPVVLAGNVQSDAADDIQTTLAGLDHSLAHFSPAQRKQVLQLFDLLSMPVTRGPLTGIWGRWEQAREEDIQGFLERWQNSSFTLLRLGHASLLQLLVIAWYGSQRAWPQAGYPGPPQIPAQ